MRPPVILSFILLFLYWIFWFIMNILIYHRYPWCNIAFWYPCYLIFISGIHMIHDQCFCLLTMKAKLCNSWCLILIFAIHGVQLIYIWYPETIFGELYYNYHPVFLYLVTEGKDIMVNGDSYGSKSVTYILLCPEYSDMTDTRQIWSRTATSTTSKRLSRRDERTPTSTNQIICI